MQKKIIKSFIIGLIIFICFVVFYGIEIPADKMYSIINIVNTILINVFAICGLYMVSNNLYSKVDISVYIMARSYILTAVFSLINILYIVNGVVENDIMMRIRANNLYRNMLEVLFLIISTEVVTEKFNKIRWTFKAIALTVLSVIWTIIRNLLYYQNNCVYELVDKYIGIFLISIAFIGWIIQKYKLRQDEFLQNNKFNTFYLNRVITGIIVVHMYKFSIVINVLYNILDLVFYICIFSYICESTVDLEWKSIEVKIDSKEEEVQRKLIEKRILVASAKSVRKKISYMNKIAKEAKEIAVKDMMLDQVNYLQKIIKNCNRLIKLSHNIVSLNKYDAGIENIKFEKVDMIALINDLTSSIEPYLEDKKLQLQCISVNKEIICDVDREAIERILLNLVSNSVKYSKYGGYINIVTFIKKDKVCLIVQDTGVGIPENLISTVFNQYARAESDLIRQQEGSGLGLTIVKSLVDMHRGEIEIKSKLGRGTSINIILPMYQVFNEVKEYKSNVGTGIANKVEIEFSDIEV